MATNKHATIRYQTLDKCFRNSGRRYFMEDLIEACNKSLNEFTGAEIEIQKRQIFEDIKFMESEQGWSIELYRIKEGRKVYYRYIDPDFSINHALLNESEQIQLREVLGILAKFKGLSQFGWMEETLVRLESSFGLKGPLKSSIEFEQNLDLNGLEFFGQFFNSILYEKAVDIKYQGFKQSQAEDLVFHPYYLKQYNNRWFVFGRKGDRDSITNIALDRVLAFKESLSPFIPNDLVNFEEYFDEVIGVSISEQSKPEQVLMKIDTSLWPYIKSKPIHGSQKVKERHADYILISLKVYINYELVSTLFSLGEGLTVIQPAPLAEMLKVKAEQVLKNYF